MGCTQIYATTIYLNHWVTFNISFTMWSSNTELDTFTKENFTFSRYSDFTNIYLNSVQFERFFLTEFNREFFAAVITHRPSSKSLDIKILKNLIKKSNMIPLEHSKSHFSNEIHPTHRQDIGKVSFWDSLFFH